MAENKKSFLLYADMVNVFDELSDDEAGRLIKHLLHYVNDRNPTAPDKLTKIAFEPIKLQLKRDLQKWGVEKEIKSHNGIIGNLKRWHYDLYKQYLDGEISLDKASEIANNRKPSLPDKNVSTPIAKIAVNVNDTVNVNDNVTDIKDKESKSVTIVPLIVNYKIDFEVFWTEYDKKVGDKDKIKKKWDKFSVETQNKILDHIPKYKLSQPEKKFRKNPDTFFNQKSWNDELIISIPQSKLSAAAEAYKNSHNPYDNE